ncbi:hypothetical protein WMY93_024123 [Mugilogobius chulae]|uniref:Uncharacterized protein n=1 Tax=Mugilogobius chulae TaxID=88201 RepID=A0AAW0NAN3_9GOBI
MFYGRSVTGEPLHIYDTVVDLLEAVNLSQPISGVSSVHTTTGILYKLRSKAPHLTLPSEYSQYISSNISSSLGLFLREKSLRAQDVVRMAINVELERVTFFVECDEPVVVPITSEESVNLTFPGDVLVTVGSTPGRKHSKFTGYLINAELSVKAFEKRVWNCDTTDSNDSDQNSANWTMSHQNAPSSKPEQKQSPSNVQVEQRDQQHRGVALGPPSPPLRTKTGANLEEDRLASLELKLSQLSQMVDMMKTQNAELQTRVQYLEGCECVRPGPTCVWEGRDFQEGERWHTDLDTLCTCTAGQVRCQANSREE